MERNKDLFKLIEAGLYAAIIILAITFIRIPMPSVISNTFIHPGNALVILGGLLMGVKRGAFAAAIGLFLFDLLNGYASVAIFTVVENLLVMAVVELVYRLVFKRQDTPTAIVTVGVVGAITKIVIIFIKYTVAQLLLGSSLSAALAVALTGMPASLFTALVTAILVPILYFPMKRVFEQFHPVGE